MNNVHGDDAYRYNNIRYNFSSNIYGHADLSALKEHLASRLSAISSYPEPEPESLESLIAENEGVKVDNIIAGNGATAIIYMIAEMMRGKTFSLHQPTFSEYGTACRLHDMRLVTSENKPQLEWICNPNNPDGRVWDKEDLLRHIDTECETLFVIDASYEDYTLASLPSTKELLERENVITLHSMTKRYCIPGLRLGYAVAHTSLVKRLKQLRQPWSVNSLAIEAGKYLLSNDLHLLPPINIYKEEAEKLESAINSIAGFKAIESSTTYFLCTSGIKASTLKDTLATEYGILIRDASNFPSLSTYHFRIATQSSDDNNVLIRALKSIKMP